MKIDPRDYFSKYGFEDGDNKKLVRAARKMLQFVQALINREFEKGNLEYKAVEVEMNTCHNPVRLFIVLGDKMFMEWEWSEFNDVMEEIFNKIGILSERNRRACQCPKIGRRKPTPPPRKGRKTHCEARDAMHTSCLSC